MFNNPFYNLGLSQKSHHTVTRSLIPLLYYYKLVVSKTEM